MSIRACEIQNCVAILSKNKKANSNLKFKLSIKGSAANSFSEHTCVYLCYKLKLLISDKGFMYTSKFTPLMMKAVASTSFPWNARNTFFLHVINVFDNDALK